MDLYGGVTISDEGMHNLGLCMALVAFEQGVCQARALKNNSYPEYSRNNPFSRFIKKTYLTIKNQNINFHTIFPI